MANLNVAGVSYHTQTEQAVNDSLTQITQRLSGRLPNCLFVFSNHQFDSSVLVRTLKNLSPQALIVGMSISHLCFHNTAPTLAIIGTHLDTNRLVPGVGLSALSHPQQAVNQALSQILGSADNQIPTQLIIFTAQPQNLDQALPLISQGLSTPVPIYVFTAFAPDQSQGTVFFNDQALQQAVVALGIYGQPIINATSYNSFTPIGKPERITSQKPYHLISVNNQPAVHLYEQFLPSHHLSQLPPAQFQSLTSAFPLCLFTSPDLTIISPLSATPEGSLVLPIEIPHQSNLVSLSSHDLTQIEPIITQKFTPATTPEDFFVSFNSYNRHVDIVSEQSETQLIEKTLGLSTPMLSITCQGFNSSPPPIINYTHHGRLVVNLT